MNGPNDGAAARGTGARRRLVQLLREIAELAGERSLKRCPYRSARDLCTFRGECGNRYRAPGARALCLGGPLNARAASAEEVAAVLEGLGAAQQQREPADASQGAIAPDGDEWPAEAG